MHILKNFVDKDTDNQKFSQNDGTLLIADG